MTTSNPTQLSIFFPSENPTEKTQSSELVEPQPRAVEVIRSRKRRKTIQAQERNGVVQIFIPDSLSRREEAEWVDKMVARVAPKVRNDDDLAVRASQLARRYGFPTPASIAWSRRTSVWGFCEIATRTIQLSARLQTLPNWVQDYVIVHELAHLVIASHNRSFWALVQRYPRAERARGYLLAIEERDHS